MRIIKLQIQQAGQNGIQIIKYAVSLDQKKYPKIGRFITHVQKVCQLDDIPYELSIDGFRIPNHDKTKVLKESNVYRLKISHSSRKDYQTKSSQLSDPNQNNPASKSKSSYQHIVDKKSKQQQKIEKIARKMSLSQSSSSQSCSSSPEDKQSSSSDSSSSSSSSEEIRIKSTKRAKKVKAQSSSDQSQPLQQLRNKIDRHFQKDTSKSQKKNQAPAIASLPKKKVEVAKAKSLSSESEQSQDLPSIKAKKVAPAPQKVQNKSTLPKSFPQNSDKTKQNQSKSLFVNPKRNTVISDDSSSQSQPSQKTPKKLKVVAESIPKDQKAKPQANITEAKPKNQIKIPPALRNKQVKKNFDQHKQNNFDQHKQNQWIIIEKENLKKWQQQGHKNVCQANNKIRFKIVQLDEEKFIPVKSGWITAEVKEVNINGNVSLMKVEQQGKPYRQTFEIPEHNMDELQLNRLLATNQQIQAFDQKPKVQEKKVQQDKDDKEVQIFNSNNDKNSLQKFICGQANYYFSDKNYNFDLFMQMHANRDPQKYLNLSILLNFPKIKKFLKDEEKLIEYLKTDEKYAERSYQIDFERRMIRKKGLVKAPEAVKPAQKNAQQPPQIQQSGQVKSVDNSQIRNIQ